jgi:hypothetical protein
MHNPIDYFMYGLFAGYIFAWVQIAYHLGEKEDEE